MKEGKLSASRRVRCPHAVTFRLSMLASKARVKRDVILLVPLFVVVPTQVFGHNFRTLLIFRRNLAWITWATLSHTVYVFAQITPLDSVSGWFPQLRGPVRLGTNDVNYFSSRGSPRRSVALKCHIIVQVSYESKNFVRAEMSLVATSGSKPVARPLGRIVRLVGVLLCIVSKVCGLLRLAVKSLQGRLRPR